MLDQIFQQELRPVCKQHCIQQVPILQQQLRLLSRRSICKTQQRNLCYRLLSLLLRTKRRDYCREQKNLKLESAKDSDCRQLTQEMVQDVNSHLANGKATQAQRFLRGETTTGEQ